MRIPDARSTYLANVRSGAQMRWKAACSFLSILDVDYCFDRHAVMFLPDDSISPLDVAQLGSRHLPRPPSRDRDWPSIDSPSPKRKRTGIRKEELSPAPKKQGSDTSDSVRIANVGRKGLGVVATITLAPGKVVLSERPFLKLRDPITSSSVMEAVKEMDQTGQQLFWSLPSNGACDLLALDIAENNIIDLDGEEGVSGIFETLCRVNHSCAPNCRWRHDPSSRMMGTLHTKPKVRTRN